MKNSTTWSSTIKTKPASAGSEELFYCIPTVSNGVLQIDDSLCEEGAKEWENTIVELEDREVILDDGAFHLLGKLFIISPWSRDIEDNREKELPNSIPIETSTDAISTPQPNA
ncbi:hypothetical protein FRX31_003082 [Thalictrum thalictroides]|uniref:Uncharacterized protein n=1 Tax=Thalictrum thalictroides TaxID=46969 RepID=A0A7J6XC06_THATH|nr:hypothetical protein FRX31_003082 [Thalictrum thalictroides]